VNELKEIIVLHVRSTIGMYGAEKVILNIMKESKIQGLKGSVVAIEGPSNESCSLSDSLTSTGLECDSIISTKRFDIRAIMKLRKKLIDSDITVIHTHDYKSLLFSLLAKVFTNKKIVHHIHGSLGNTKAEKLYAVIERVCMMFVSRIITVSQNQKDDISQYRYLRNNVIQINNGTVMPDFDLSVSKIFGVFSMVMVARFTPEKNHTLAIEVVKYLVNIGKNVELILLGDGPNRAKIIDLINKYELNNNVRLIGFSDDVQGWLSSSQLLLITSKTEGMPMCLLEAMSMGLPTVSTPVGEIPKLLSSSKSGLVAIDKESLVKSIILLMDDKQVYEHYSNNARKYCEDNLSVRQQVTDLSKIYMKLGDKL